MAGSQVDKTVAIDFFQQAVLGYQAARISNYANTLEPKVQAGTVIEISQELYEFASEETLTGWSGISDATQAYIYFVPSGTSCTVIFSATAPTWNDAKNGWYNGNDRALWAVYRTDSTTYSNKARLANQKHNREFNDKYIEGSIEVEGDITSGGDVTATGTATFPGGVDIGGAGSFIKVKLFSGTLGAASPFSTPHGLTLSKIIGYIPMSAVGGGWAVPPGDGTNTFTCDFSSVNLRFIYSAGYNGQAYKVMVFYTP